MNEKQDWFVPIGLILGWMNRGEFGFENFSIPNLATAIEISEPLHIDRFDRLRKATPDAIASLLDGLEEYYISVSYLGKIPDDLRLALAENWDGAREMGEKLLAEKKAQTASPPGSHKFGWMYSTLPALIEQAKAATDFAPLNSPDARRAMIKARVDAANKRGIAKTKTFGDIAKEQNISLDRVKEIYYK